MLKDIRLAIAIAVGVCGGMTAWSWINPVPHALNTAPAAFLQQAALGDRPVDVRLVDVLGYVTVPVQVTSDVDVGNACGGKFLPCHVIVDR